MFVAALGLLIGVILGGLGGGGGVLTVPALVHLLGMSAQDATTSSVVIVGTTAVVGVLARTRGGSSAGVPAWPPAPWGVPAAAAGSVLNQRVAEPVLLLSFSALTVLAATAMILDWRRTPAPVAPEPDTPVVALTRVFAVVLLLVGAFVAVESVLALWAG